MLKSRIDMLFILIQKNILLAIFLYPPKVKILKFLKMIVVSKSYGCYWFLFVMNMLFVRKSFSHLVNTLKKILNVLILNNSIEYALGIDRGIMIAVQIAEKSYTLASIDQAT